MSEWIMWEVSDLFENIGTVRDGISSLSRPIAVQDVPDAPKLEVRHGAIEFDKISFAYGGTVQVFRGLDLQIAPGEKVGVIGRSGAGKSTLVNLLLRFFELDHGAIRIDGQDVSAVTQASLRALRDMTDTSVVLEMAPSDYTKEMWDKNFLCTFSVSLEEDQLSTKMLVENKGDAAFDFQAALHSYFTVSSLENLEITGSFAGKEFLNKMVGEGEMQTEDREVITISEEYDRVYKGVNDPVLKDSGTGKSLGTATSFNPNASSKEDHESGVFACPGPL